MTIIKICGITSVEDALKTAKLGADIIGLVFAESKRRISMEIAVEISSALHKLDKYPALAGVFVNQPARVVNTMAERCELDIVQLSGDESWYYCRDIKFPVIKAIHISNLTRPEEVHKQISMAQRAGLKHPFICLLDTKIDSKYGGTGQVFKWDVASEALLEFPVIIAGGLNVGNVSELISKVRPLGVDVSSGVETDGRKDMLKIKDFIKAVRSVDSASDSNFMAEFLSKENSIKGRSSSLHIKRGKGD